MRQGFVRRAMQKYGKAVWDSFLELAQIWDRSHPSKFQMVLRTGASIGVLKKNFYPRVVPAEVLERHGFSLILSSITDFVYKIMKEYGHQMEPLWEEQRSRNETVRIDRFKLGKCGEVCFVVDVYYGNPQVKDGIFANIELGEFYKRWGEFFWGVFGKAATFEVFRQGWSWDFRVVSLKLLQKLYIGPYNDEILLSEIRAFSDVGFSRCILLVGEPGNGKTTLAHRIAAKVNGPLLQITPKLIERVVGSANIVPIVQLLQPGVLLINDIHLMSENAVESLLHAMEWLNDTIGPETLVIATANDFKSINKALVRPERFDRVVFMDKLDEKERLDILQLYGEVFECAVPDQEALLEKVAKETERFSPVYLKEIMKMMRAVGHWGNLEKLLMERVEEMKKIQGVGAEESSEKEGEEGTGVVLTACSPGTDPEG